MSADDMSVPAAELVIVGHYDRGSGYATRRASGSPSWLLMWTQEGAGLVEQGGATLTAGPGDLVVLASRAAHHYRTAGERWRFWWVHFQPRPSWVTWLRPYALSPGCHLTRGSHLAPPLQPTAATTLVPSATLAPGSALAPDATLPPGSALAPGTSLPSAGLRAPGRQLSPGSLGQPGAEPPSLSARIEEAFLRAHAYARWSGRGVPPEPGETHRPVAAMAERARELVLGAVEEILLLATSEAPDAFGPHPDDRGASGPGVGGLSGARPGGVGVDRRVARALELIAAEPGAPHTVASLAAAVALSPSRFAHVFAERTGRTPMRAVRAARLAHAAQLLEATDLDIGQVAAACGFVSPFHFSRTFAHEYGLPPRAYRRRLGS
ncbi:AraC family transcriptional regulator [Nonomuraea endophytica]|uniref:AraC family transcriptional regulator of arabinose operon n=1 Tax=Nonomuraea endophytica TaxID=714136 RepID=A0A7W8A355_9ACTN|nr:AraC family transcriptional regulator [Nonomuraea endophytica]MBB5077871.1 AraC family transcriptional regulator of arabinose operon [Nonomuraea endophytica]